LDTLTHALSGALIARATAPAAPRISLPRRIAAGFLTCAFPDSDVVLSYAAPITYLTLHRGVTHSFVLLPLWAFLLSWIFAKLDRGKSWRDYFGICAIALSAHIVGDLITSFGTMIYAPISNARIAWNTTFIIDLWFTGIIVTGLVASLLWRRSRLPAAAALGVLATYVGLQAMQRERAIDFGREYAQSNRLDRAAVSAVPRPVSPFNWLVIIEDEDRYLLANVNLLRESMLPVPDANAGFIARLNSAYAPLDQAQWKTVYKYGRDPAQRDLAAWALAHPKLAFYRWFAAYPALYRIDGNCVWFEDLRFLIPGREAFGFRYGLCDEDRGWEAFHLLDENTREPVERPFGSSRSR
jgi:inner membrane protein